MKGHNYHAGNKNDAFGPPYHPSWYEYTHLRFWVNFSGVTGEFNGLVTAFVHQGQGESPVAYALRIVSFLQAVGNVALALIIGGLLAGIVGYIRKE